MKLAQLMLRVELPLYIDSPETAIADAIRLAVAHNRPVVFNWDGVDVHAYPNSTTASVDGELLALLAAKSERDKVAQEAIVAPTFVSRRPLVYIMGPFRADTPYQIEQNIRQAEDHGLLVAKFGGIPVIPHTMYRFFQNSLPDAFWLDAGIALLRICNIAAACIPFARVCESRGVQRERYDARVHEIPIYYNDDDESRSALATKIETWIKEHS